MTLFFDSILILQHSYTGPKSFNSTVALHVGLQEIRSLCGAQKSHWIITINAKWMFGNVNWYSYWHTKDRNNWLKTIF